MRRTLIWVTLVLCGALGIPRAAAQSVPPPWAIGVLVGATSASLSGDAPASTKFSGQRGFSAAAVFERRLAPEVSISVQPGFTRRQTGIAFEIPGEDEPRDSLSVRLDYLNVPVLVKIFSGSGRIYVAGGLDFGWALSSTMTGAGAPVDIADAIRDVDVGGVFAFGITFPIGAPRLVTELRYVQSIVNASTGEGSDDTVGPVRFRSRGLQLTLGITFPLGQTP
jgi:Outer membrane protein beta-barrel domain